MLFEWRLRQLACELYKTTGQKRHTGKGLQRVAAACVARATKNMDGTMTKKNNPRTPRLPQALQPRHRQGFLFLSPSRLCGTKSFLKEEDEGSQPTEEERNALGEKVRLPRFKHLGPVNAKGVRRLEMKVASHVLHHGDIFERRAIPQNKEASSPKGRK